MRIGVALFAVGLAVGVSVSPVALAMSPATGAARPASDRGGVVMTGAPSATSDGGAAIVTAAEPARPDRRSGRRSCRPALPLRERAAQVLVVGLPGVTDAAEPLGAEVARLGVGGVFVNDSNVVAGTQVRKLTRGLRRRSRLPLLVATDEETGRVSTFRPLIGGLPSPRSLAATGTASDIRAVGRGVGRALADLGVDLDLAPVADLDGGDAYGLIGDRSFSSDPATAARASRAFARGLADAGVVPVVKHFPGHAGAGGDVHSAASTADVPLRDLLAVDVAPFAALVDAGVPAVMLGHVTYSALDARRPASLSPASYRLLRDLGFEGVAMTDSLGMGAISRRWSYADAAAQAVRAGADAVLATDGTRTRRMVRGLVRAVRSGRLAEARLNEAAGRVLALKGLDPRPLTCTAPPRAAGLAGRLLRGAGRR